MKNARLRYFFWHLIISFLIIASILTAIFIYWYPVPLIEATGSKFLFYLIIIVDLIIGPLLGLLVYKEGKKTLKIDLTIIIFLQFLAVGYGIYTLEKGRPVWIVYTSDRFELIRKNEIFDNDLSKINKNFRQPFYLKPQFAAVIFSKSGEQFNKDLFLEVVGGVSLAQFPSRYVPLNQVGLNLKQRVQTLEILENYNTRDDIQNFLNKYPEADSWLPLKANALDMVVLMNRDSAKVVKIVDLRPWK